MSFLKCSCFKSPPSPDADPVQLHDVSQDGRRFTISTQYTGDTSLDDNGLRAPPHDIFESTNASYNPITPHSAQFMLRGRDSLQRIHHAAAKKLREKTSRDSTDHVPVKVKPPDDQLKSDLTDTLSVVQDKDAELLKTPTSTLRHRDSQKSGSIRISPQALRRIMNRSTSPSPQPRAEAAVESYIRASPTQAKRRVLTKMLTDRVASLEGTSTIKDGKSVLQEDGVAASFDVRDSPKKYVFSDMTTPEHVRSSSSPESVMSLSQQASDMKQRRFSAMSACMPGSDRYRNAAPDVTESDQEAEGSGKMANADSQMSSGNNEGRPSWMRGASGVFADSRRPSIRSKQETQRLPPSQEDHPDGVDGGHSRQHTRSESHGSNFANSVHLYNIGISRQLASSGPLLSATASSPELRSRSTSTSTKSFEDTSKYYSMLTTRGVPSSGSGISSSQIPSGWGSPKRRPPSSFYPSRSRQVSLPESRRFSIQDLSIPGQYPDLLASGPSAVNKLPTLDRNASQRTTDAASDGSQVKRFRPPLQVPKRRMQIAAEGVQRSQSLPSQEARSVAMGRLHELKDKVPTRYFSPADINDLSAEIAMRRTPSARFSGRYDGSNETSMLLAAPVAIDFARPSTSWSAYAATGPQRRVSIEPLRPSSSWSAHPWAHPADEKSMSPRRRPSVMALGAVGTSAWDKALQEHAREDVKIGRRRPGSISHDELRRHSTLESLTPLSSMWFRDDSDGRDENALQSLLTSRRSQRAHMYRGMPAHQRPVSSSSSTSWTRFPSHTRRQRIDAPAGEDDLVFSRDFATAQGPTRNTVSSSRSLPPMSKDKRKTTPDSSPLSKKKLQAAATRIKIGIRKAHSGNHLVKLKSSLRDFSRTKGNELKSMLAVDDARGHRSSVSAGALKTEVSYPELEMLSPVMSAGPEEGAGGYFPSFEDYLNRDAAAEIGKMDWGGGGAQRQWGAANAAAGVGVEDVSPGGARMEVEGDVGAGREETKEFELALPTQKQNKPFELSFPAPKKKKEFELSLPAFKKTKSFELSIPAPKKDEEPETSLPEQKPSEKLIQALSTEDQRKDSALFLSPPRQKQDFELSLPQPKKNKKTVGALYPSFIPMNAQAQDPSAVPAAFELTLPMKQKGKNADKVDPSTTTHASTAATTEAKPLLPGESAQAFQLTLPSLADKRKAKARSESQGVVQARIQQFDSDAESQKPLSPLTTPSTSPPMNTIPRATASGNAYDALSFSRTRRDRSSTTAGRNFSESSFSTYSGTATYARVLSRELHRDLQKAEGDGEKGQNVGESEGVGKWEGEVGEVASSPDGSSSVKSSEIPVAWRHVLPRSQRKEEGGTCTQPLAFDGEDEGKTEGEKGGAVVDLLEREASTRSRHVDSLLTDPGHDAANAAERPTRRTSGWERTRQRNGGGERTARSMSQFPPPPFLGYESAVSGHFSPLDFDFAASSGVCEGEGGDGV